jgi:hypothetical protein
MFYLYLILFFLILVFLFFFLTKKKKIDEDVGEGLQWISSILGAIVLLIFIIVNLAVYSSQLNRFEQIHRIQQEYIILTEKYSELSETFIGFLGEKYLEHEKKVFTDISSKKETKLAAILIQYPELRSAETFIELTKKIHQITDEVYFKRLILEEIYRSIRYREISPWIFFLPPIPENLKKEIYKN